MNPGGSVKDRAALGILLAAEASGDLKAGGTVVEGTAGNTGIGLAHLCNARGYRCVIVIPETQSAEKIDPAHILGRTDLHSDNFHFYMFYFQISRRRLRRWTSPQIPI